MSKILITILALITFPFALNSLSTESGEKAVVAKIRDHLSWALERHNMACMGQGMGSPHGKIENIGIYLKRAGFQTIEEARILAISGIKDLIHRLNQIEGGGKTLSSFPCCPDDLYYSIYFTDNEGNTLRFAEPGRYISGVIISGGKIFYLFYPKPRGPSKDILIETYAEGLKNIQITTDSQANSTKQQN